MGGLEIMFLVGLYFVVADLPQLFTRPIQSGSLVRFIAGAVLVILAMVGVNLLG